MSSYSSMESVSKTKYHSLLLLCCGTIMNINNLIRVLFNYQIFTVLISLQVIKHSSCLTPRYFFSARHVSSTKVFNSRHKNDGVDDVSQRNNGPRTYNFSIPLVNARPKPQNFIGTFVELWNDPRPVSSLISNSDRSNVGLNNADEKIPYCIISDEFDVENEKFQVLLYPRGRFVSTTVSGSDSSNEIYGPASAYLRYLPKKYGDEIDIAWKMQLVDNRRPSKPLPVVTSGGLPKSNDTWSAAMTFCTEVEAVESVGRATDWGSSTWSANDVCNALGHIEARGEISVFGEPRSGQNSFWGWPIASKGALGAVQRSIADSSSSRNESSALPRIFRVGEVIVPIDLKNDPSLQEELNKSFVYPGVDYRIMTMSDKDGNAIFSTESLPDNEQSSAKLALRPCGWKLQQQLWQRDGMVQDWPVEIEAGLLSSNALSRFNPGSAIPRITSAFKRDWVTYTLALFLAIAPIPLALVGRNAVSFYAIPSASMEPTLMKGDLLLVEKLPGIYGRTQRGDVILFKPPKSLRDVIINNGGSPISGTSLFVKRIVGLPGDKNILMDESTKEVQIDNNPSFGPDRNLCDDEPLRLIDRLLQNGQGKQIDELGENDVYVLGDCKAVSVDSRVFGTLPKENIVGKPVARFWPPSRFSNGPF